MSLNFDENMDHENLEEQYLYMITIINANFQDLLQILEMEDIAIEMFSLSSTTVLFSTSIDMEEIVEIFKEYEFLLGLNFIILNITNIADTDNMYLKFHPEINPKLKEIMNFVLKFYNPADLQNQYEKIVNKKKQEKTKSFSLNQILEKINKKGMKSLSFSEKKYLEERSEN
jgi:hypothetical protein